MTRDWRQRQEECEAWYDDLLRNPEGAENCLRADHALLVEDLVTMRGDILDIGGGAGITRHFIPQRQRYVSIDPSTKWIQPEWEGLANRFAEIDTPLRFIRGVAERLPFKDKQFDAVLFIWSLNHVANPSSAVAESARVLRSGGVAYIVLEDMPPRIFDFLRRGLRKTGLEFVRELIATRFRSGPRGRSWPVHPDHSRIVESDLRRWTRGEFQLVSRRWLGQRNPWPQAYLTFLFRKLPRKQE